MVVSVVQVREVRVGVHERLVGVAVGLPPGVLHPLGMVVAMVVVVLVDVLDDHMGMGVLVVRAEDEDYAQRGDRRRDQLVGGRRVAEHHPRHDDADERSGREDQLTSCCADVTSPGHPQGDRRP